MSGIGVKTSQASPDVEVLEPAVLTEHELDAVRARQAEFLRHLWDRRRTIFRTAVLAFVVSTAVALAIPKSYTSTAQLMPPDTQSPSSMAMVAAMTAKASPGLAGMAGDLLGLKSSGALFIGVLRSETAQDDIVDRFRLQKAYGAKLIIDARKRLDANTMISEDRKSGIISISVTDRDPQRAADLANGYVEELNALVNRLSTSAAHRERVFLEDRLKVAKVDLDDASSALAQFSSRNNTLDIQTEGKAMLDAASTLAGQLVAAQAELEGLRQIYTDNNARVKALNGRVAELRKQLQKLGGLPPGSAPAGTTTANASNSSSAAGAADPPSAADTSSSQAADAAPGKIGGLPFPSIRSLPLLGAKYSDYYRRAKIQETVFELLTEQYELAKVEEAKETPSVKVLDPGKVPERKSYPPRLLIISLSTFLSVAGVLVWVIGARNWEKTAPTDPRKVLAQEIAATVKARLPWATPNGHSSASPENVSELPRGENGDTAENGHSASRAPGSASPLHKIWQRFTRRPPANGGPSS
jgi:capsule polysaccharide export protein KpsE/RkpR